MENNNFITIVLAAGKGTRMKSKLPKVLHKVGGKPMVNRVLEAASLAGSEKNIVILGFGKEMVEKVLPENTVTVLQKEQLGTGHAVLQAKDLVNPEDTVLILCGDTPLLSPEMLKHFTTAHHKNKVAASVLTTVMPNPTGYGRIVRNMNGLLQKIVEHKDANIAELTIKEVNTGIYLFNAKSLFEALEKVGNDNAQGEYYLPDVLPILHDAGQKIEAVVVDDYEETLGINSRLQLSRAEAILRERKNYELMRDGVTIIDPANTYIDSDVTIEPDCIIYPSTWIEGKTIIHSGCEIGPGCRFSDVEIGANSTISFTYAHECRIGKNVTVGPYVHLRPNTVISDNVHIGNFMEVKNSNIGEGTKLPHLSYIGDSDIGKKVNMGCGTITVNYDGKVKHRTTIADNAFVGCNSNLVAPVTVGEGAYIGAGSTITKDVPAHELAIARERQKNIPNWVDKRR